MNCRYWLFFSSKNYASWTRILNLISSAINGKHTRFAKNRTLHMIRVRNSIRVLYLFIFLSSLVLFSYRLKNKLLRRRHSACSNNLLHVSIVSFSLTCWLNCGPRTEVKTLPLPWPNIFAYVCYILLLFSISDGSFSFRILFVCNSFWSRMTLIFIVTWLFLLFMLIRRFKRNGRLTIRYGQWHLNVEEYSLDQK